MRAVSFGGVRLSPMVQGLITTRDYPRAAEQLIVDGAPFRETVRLLESNAPALMHYLHAVVSLGGLGKGMGRVCHMYLRVALLSLTQLGKEERIDELARIREFISTYASSLEKDIVVAAVRAVGELGLLVDTYLAFDDIPGAVDVLLLLSGGDISNVLKYVPRLSVEKQRLVFLRCVQANTMQFVEYMTSVDRPLGSVVFDAYLWLVTNVPKMPVDMKENVRVLFNDLWQNGESTTDTNHLMVMLLEELGKVSEIEAFLFPKAGDKPPPVVDIPFIGRFLEGRKRWALVAKLYVGSNAYHERAVECALRDSPATMFAILDELKKRPAHNLRRCWIHALDLCSGEAGFDWARLIRGAGEARVPLDKTFARVPASINLESLHGAIATSVKEISGQIHQATQACVQIEQRAEKYRQAAQERPAAVTCEGACWFCDQPISDTAFFAYPCGHTVHAGCAGVHAEEGCPGCGLGALVILDTPLVDWSVDRDAVMKWSVPR